MKWSAAGWFAPRQPVHDWTQLSPPLSLLDYRDFVVDDVATLLVERKHTAVAEIWLGLQEGHLLAARRPRVLDELVASGVDIHVSSTGNDDPQALVPNFPVDLAGALVRRVRFICRALPSAATSAPLVHVVDLGWDKRR